MVFKRTVQLYAIVLAAYLVLVYLLMQSYQLDSYWGSRVLLIILALNFVIPIVAFSLMNKKEHLGKDLSTPSETDKFMQKKGSNVSWSDAKNKEEFWLFLVSFGIIIGIARMMDDNATLIVLSNSGKATAN